MVVVHGTKAFLDRVQGPRADLAEHSTTLLGSWYATVLRFRPHLALFVNESTLLPVVMHLAPAATVIKRLPDAVATVLEHHGLNPAVNEHERNAMSECRLAKTSNRSVLGVMNEFAKFARVYTTVDGIDDLVALSMRLSEIPCGPLYRTHVSPDRELRARASDFDV